MAIQLEAGSATVPALQWTSDTNTGLFSTVADTLSFTAGGTSQFTINSSGQLLVNVAGTTALPNIALASSPNTGFYIPNSNNCSLTVGGTVLFETSGGIYNRSYQKIVNIDGTNNAPAYSFFSDTNTGIYSITADELGITAGGARVANFKTSGNELLHGLVVAFSMNSTYVHAHRIFAPATDNSISCGDGTHRWTTINATNGTIQTSHSSTKTDILELSSDVEIPMGIQFRRPGEPKLHYGFLADSLPEEILYDGVGVEPSAVIGILCKRLKDAIADINILKTEIALLKSPNS